MTAIPDELPLLLINKTRYNTEDLERIIKLRAGAKAMSWTWEVDYYKPNSTVTPTSGLKGGPYVKMSRNGTEITGTKRIALVDPDKLPNVSVMIQLGTMQAMEVPEEFIVQVCMRIGDIVTYHMSDMLPPDNEYEPSVIERFVTMVRKNNLRLRYGKQRRKADVARNITIVSRQRIYMGCLSVVKKIEKEIALVAEPSKDTLDWMEMYREELDQAKRLYEATLNLPKP